jgi:hypothetical protein
MTDEADSDDVAAKIVVQIVEARRRCERPGRSNENLRNELGGSNTEHGERVRRAFLQRAAWRVKDLD